MKGIPAFKLVAVQVSYPVKIFVILTSVADPDPRSCAFWPSDPDPGPAISFSRISDPGTNPYFIDSLVTIFWVILRQLT